MPREIKISDRNGAKYITRAWQFLVSAYVSLSEARVCNEATKEEGLKLKSHVKLEI